MSEINYGLTLLYCFFAVLQVYILKSAGVKAYLRKIISDSGTGFISGVIYNFFIPVYSIIEVSRMASIENSRLYWILALITIINILLRIFLSKLGTYILDLDLKTDDAYSLANSLPALGSLALVLGEGLCFPGCPLHGDPQCDNILGLMMINFLMFCLVLFIFAFTIMASSKNKFILYKEKLNFIWYRFITIINHEDLIAKVLIYKYFKDSNFALKLFKDFSQNYKLECDEKFNYFIKNNKKEQTKHQSIKVHEIPKINSVSQNIELKIDPKTQSYNQNNLNLFESFFLDEIFIQDFKKSTVNRNQSIIENDISITKQTMINNEKKADEVITTNKLKVKKVNQKQRSKSNDFINYSKRVEFYEKLKIFNKKNIMLEKAKVVINLYYSYLFDFILKNLNDFNEQNNDTKINNNFEKEKVFIISKINSNDYPSFNICDSLKIGRNEKPIFDVAWQEFEKLQVELDIKSNFNFVPQEVNAMLIIKKVFNPPVIGCIIGLFFGISGLRDVFFSNNHYIKNVYNICNMAAKAFVPLLLTNVGNSLIKSPKFSPILVLTKFQIIYSFIFTFIIIPFVGMGMIKFWEVVYGGIIKTSKTFKFSMFISMALPLSPNFLIVISVLNGYYISEFSYLLGKQTLSLIFTETLILLIYFVIIN